MTSKISQDKEFLNALPSKWWYNFFIKFDEIDSLKVSKWKHVHLLSYFTRRYEQTYNRRYAFSFRGSPSKCTEMVFIKKIFDM